MKKIISVLIILSVLFISSAALASCSGEAKKSEKASVVVTIFPVYDWVLNILGDKKDEFGITILLDSGADLHNYQPTVKDIAAVSTSDLFIYVGGESDDWVDDTLENRTNQSMTVINLLDVLGDRAKEEELIEGMQGEEEEGEEKEEEEEEVEYDEHVWLSLRNAQIFVKEIADAISKIDPSNAETYNANSDKYIAALSDLDNEYGSAVGKAGNKTLLFGDRFPFRYLVDDYGLDYYAAFLGCSAETEASFETIIFLASKVDELKLDTIMKLEGSDGKIAQTIKNNTSAKNQKIVTINSLQSSTLAEYDNGNDYLSIMKDNLRALIDALG